MTIFRGSRYEFEPLDRVPDASGNVHLTIFPRSLQLRYNNTSFTFSQYIIKQGDRLETLAYFNYGDPTMWWLIADANPEVFHPEDDLVPGAVLRIPSYRPLRRVMVPASNKTGSIQFQQGGFSGATLR